MDAETLSELSVLSKRLDNIEAFLDGIREEARITLGRRGPGLCWFVPSFATGQPRTSEGPPYDPAELQRMFALMRTHDLWVCPTGSYWGGWMAGRGTDQSSRRLGPTPMAAVEGAAAAREVLRKDRSNV